MGTAYLDIFRQDLELEAQPLDFLLKIFKLK